MKNNLYKTYLILIWSMLICPVYCRAQITYDLTKVGQKLSVEELTTDFKYLRQVLEKAHPSLYRYMAKDSMDYYFNNAQAQIDHPMNEFGFWKIIQPVIVKTGSGHTSLSASTPFRTIVNATPHYILPFYIYINNDRMFVRDWISISNVSIDIGDEIVAIDGISAKGIIDILRSLLAGDGYSNSFKDNQLETRTFNNLYNFIFKERVKHTVTFNLNGTNKDKIINSVRTLSRMPVESTTNENTSVNKFNSPASGFEQAKPDSFYHHVYYPKDIPSTAVLKISQLSYTDYRSFHRHLFKQLKKDNIANLVLDIRNTIGGNEDVAIDLMRYLSDQKIGFIKIEEGVVDYEGFISMLNTYHQIDFSKLNSNIFKNKFPGTKLQDPYKDNFKGKVYILINGGTFSAAALLSVALKSQTNCTTIGQETGGGRFGTDGGKFAHVELPNTHLNLYLPLRWGYSMSNEKNEGCGLKPDIEFIPNAQQLLELVAHHTDPFIPFIKQIIK